MGGVDRAELSKPRSEASGLARLIRLEQRAGVFSRGHHGFFSSKGVKTHGRGFGAPEVERLLEELASRSDLVAGDAYGDRVLFPYWPHLFWVGNDEAIEPALRKLLLSTSVPWPQRSYHPPLERAAQLRDPAPVLPWLFS